MPAKRFWTLEEGTHEHHLKAQRRQEKLSDMFREFMVGKKKDQPEEQQPLSLMANWADVMRNLITCRGRTVAAAPLLRPDGNERARDRCYE